MSCAHIFATHTTDFPPTAFVIKAAISCMAGCRRCSDPSLKCQNFAIRKPSASNSAPLALEVWRGQVGRREREEREPCVRGSLVWLIGTITDNIGEVGRKLVTVLFLVICSDKSLARPTVNTGWTTACVSKREISCRRGREKDSRPKHQFREHKHTGNHLQLKTLEHA